MDTSDIGRFLPAWIIGAPLLFAIFERMRTPRAEGADRNHSTATNATRMHSDSARARPEAVPAR